MPSPFEPNVLPPVRLRFEAVTMQRDVVVPAALAVFPDPNNLARVEVLEQHTNPAQLIGLVVAVMQFATHAGIMSDVMRALVGQNSDMTSQTFNHAPPPGTPPDDLPPHLRGR